jgi:oligopeptide transport system substrate-binding protein
MNARRGAVLPAALLLGMLLCACGDRRPGGGDLSADHVARRIASAHLNRQLTQPPRTLDPALNEDVPGRIVLSDLFEGLVRLDPHGRIVPAVAERWDVSTDGKVYRFHLRPGVRWSDGEPVTAGDFVYSLRRVVDPATASPVSQMLLPIEGAEAIIAGKAAPGTLGVHAADESTLEIRLNAPTPYFLSLLTNTFALPQPEQAITRHGVAWTAPGNFVGNGAFLPEGGVGAGPLTLRRNPGYWDAGAVRLQAITYHPLPDNSAATARFLAGDFDVTDSFLIDDYRWLRERLGSQARLSPYFGTFMLAMNNARPPFDDPRLRRAMVLAVDRDILVNQLMRGLYQPAYGIVPPLPGYPEVRPDWADLPREQRLALARDLYAQAGYSADRPLRVELSYPTTTPDTRRILEAVAAMWRINLGADVKLANEEWRVFNQNRNIGKPRLYFAPWIGDYPDPQTFLAMPLPGGAQNDMRYDNPRYTQTVMAALATPDATERARLYNEAERILDEDAPYIPLYYYMNRHLLRDYVRGWADNTEDQHLARDLYLAAPAGGNAKASP